MVATGPILTEMWIEDASDDLSTVLFGRQPFEVNVEAQVPYRFWVVDDDTSTTIEVPVGRAEFGTASLSPDGRSVVFSSNDAALQVGPTSVNCKRGHGPWRPDTFHMCGELYLFDLDTGTTRQLTGLDGSWVSGTTTSGNNVNACTDIDANNACDPGSQPSGGAGSPLVFQPALDLSTQQPADYRDAAVVR